MRIFILRQLLHKISYTFFFFLRDQLYFYLQEHEKHSRFYQSKIKIKDFIEATSKQKLQIIENQKVYEEILF